MASVSKSNSAYTIIDNCLVQVKIKTTTALARQTQDLWRVLHLSAGHTERITQSTFFPVTSLSVH